MLSNSSIKCKLKLRVESNKYICNIKFSYSILCSQIIIATIFLISFDTIFINMIIYIHFRVINGQISKF